MTSFVDSGPPWCLIESDPGVFTELIHAVGVQGVQVEELYSLEPEAFTSLVEAYGEIYGIVFLFKWSQQSYPKERELVTREYPENLFFAKQVITNACATQAIVSILLNATGEVDVGGPLRDLQEFTRGFSPQMKGLALSNSEPLRDAHNAFRGTSSFVDTSSTRMKKRRRLLSQSERGEGDAFHFVSYVPYKGKIYELDGLREFPLTIGTYSEESNNSASTRLWLRTIRDYISSRVSWIQEQTQKGQCLHDDESGGVELRFNVMAIVKDRLLQCQKRLRSFRKRRFLTAVQLLSFGEEVSVDDDDDDENEDTALEQFSCGSTASLSCEKLHTDFKMLSAEVENTSLIIQEEQRKRQLWAVENQRRRHDFVPFVLCAFVHLARTGLLSDVYTAYLAEHAALHRP